MWSWCEISVLLKDTSAGHKLREIRAAVEKSKVIWYCEMSVCGKLWFS